jgi:hypothetical protein
MGQLYLKRVHHHYTGVLNALIVLPSLLEATGSQKNITIFYCDSSKEHSKKLK